MKEFFTKNREKLGHYLQNGDMALVFSGRAKKSSADGHHDFVVNKNFYYLTGLRKENFALLVKKNDEAVESVLFIEKPNYNVEKWFGRKLPKEEAIKRSGIDKVHFIEDLEQVITRSIYDGKIMRVYLDLEKISWDEVDGIHHKYARDIRVKFPHVPVLSIHNAMSELRMIKEDFEIEEIKKAIGLTKLGLEEIMKTIRPGVMEYELEAAFRYAIRKNGADGNAFPTIAASGEDAVILHYVENDKAVPEDALVLMDLGAQYQEYASDITRTFPASGTFTPRQKELYDIVLKALEATIEVMKPGVPYKRMNEVCKETLIEELKAIGLITKDEEINKYYYHGVGHYMGLDTHDLGARDTTLQPGMVITCEPGLYIAEEGIGIRIEDDILITEDGNENLSKSIIKKTEEIEAFMKQHR